MQMMVHAHMWAVHISDIELKHANMLKSAPINELMAHADIVLMNNKVFGEKCTFLFYAHFFMF